MTHPPISQSSPRIYSSMSNHDMDSDRDLSDDDLMGRIRLQAQKHLDSQAIEPDMLEQAYAAAQQRVRMAYPMQQQELQDKQILPWSLQPDVAADLSGDTSQRRNGKASSSIVHNRCIQ